MMTLGQPEGEIAVTGPVKDYLDLSFKRRLVLDGQEEQVLDFFLGQPPNTIFQIHQVRQGAFEGGVKYSETVIKSYLRSLNDGLVSLNGVELRIGIVPNYGRSGRQGYVLMTPGLDGYQRVVKATAGERKVDLLSSEVCLSRVKTLTRVLKEIKKMELVTGLWSGEKLSRAEELRANLIAELREQIEAYHGGSFNEFRGWALRGVEDAGKEEKAFEGMREVSGSKA
ncbi:MAG: hypothetical protein UX85_C0004G0060 [Candidatus Beckwithbacteria bacterium GW2011_GWB1_47_15]|uniref:Uncharacterized protein n=1 Tax=Candidatus Beckwithbacteria bacterium GW2011_GWB1_47_15 TaxID=1618371 RepID=A0A0G1U4A3_9BACT|nr:MAG: hypothetical protein UY43_C0001G0183 [Candidatus Beckwithbacteria bacterium GW2011_GWC1_49_16]KKU35463.1 MAG: hypothetical protein UX50_C0003G0060 [Candidatus Beckwithbacteria bacterium GW2011_GWA1_46_30]KKU61138.1 MAG: hypothetical protein UX85_C0004G0060 [Candidatus Beckwithbacteria bacterium GW2011_GWB1_47_15]KKU71977.1 MAG: hypothetical protein UX97_C0002G0060 [Candidatus Beckwithbacteria bacterium GW2011_GWA2_47_25]KKW03214.1 MAG: hypothetical protein UY37_C0006G0039 [Candidatus Be